MADRASNERTGKFIKELRLSHNLTQEQLGECVHISRKAVSKWENGKSFPSLDEMYALASYFDITYDELVAGKFLSSRVNTDDIKFNLHDVPAETNRTFAVIMIVLFILLVISPFLFNLKRDNKFILNYEDENFSITNGELDLDGKDSSLSLGTFYSNRDDIKEGTDYHFCLCIDSCEESKSLFFNHFDIVSIPLDFGNLLKKTLTENKSEIYLKILYTNKYNEEILHSIKNFIITYNDIDETKVIKRNFSSDLLKMSDNYKELKFANRMTDMNTFDEENEELLDFSFLFDTNYEELKLIYDNRDIVIDKKFCIINLEKHNNAEIFSFADCNVKVNFILNKKQVVIDNYSYYVDETNLKELELVKEYDLIIEILSELKKVRKST